jgi:molecular chaperone GrpE
LTSVKYPVVAYFDEANAFRHIQYMNEDDVVFERDGREEDGLSEEELEAVESRADSKVHKLKRELEATKKEKQEYLDGWQRSKADYVNALKRFEEEKKAAQTNGLAKAVKAFLPAYDALERAKASGELPEGFAGIAKQLEAAFAGFGVNAHGTEGELFDPAKHEALGTDPTDDPKKDDTISAVLEQGYAIGEDVLRPARVRVFQHER